MAKIQSDTTSNCGKCNELHNSKGGGKTFSILVDNLYGVHDPEYFSLFVRLTNTELDTNLWPAAKSMYMPLLKDDDGRWIGKSHISEQDHTITFASGARSKFAYCLYPKDADAYYGAELCKVYIDEFQAHTEYTFNVLRSRNRSTCDKNIPRGMRFTLNPSPTHFMYEWIEPFLLEDESGFPDPALGGKVRYFLIIKDVLYTSWDRQELADRFDKRPQTYTYVPATLTDNKVLMELDPEYYDVLDSMPEDKRNQLLLGCWKLSEDIGLYFQRGFFKKASHVPLGSKYVRGWDTAATAPEEGKKVAKGDWTAGVKMAKSSDGDYYIVGMDHFQDRSGPRDTRMLRVGHEDGVDCHLICPQDPAAAGKFALEEFMKKAIQAGLICKKDLMPTTKSKLSKAEPYATAVQNGFVYIVESTFSKEKLEWFYKEHDLFDGERSTATKKDDVIDAAATAFNFLAAERVIPSFHLGSNNTQSRFAQLNAQVVPDFK